MVGVVRVLAIGVRAGALPAVLALTLAPLGALAQESATIPLHLNGDGSGFSNMVVVSVAGGKNSSVLLDTGSTGLYIREKDVGASAVPLTDDDGKKIKFKYGYSSGNVVRGYYATATVAFPEASTVLSADDIVVGVVTKLTCKSSKPDCPGWQTGQKGVMGVAYSAEPYGIFNPLAQLSGNYGNGFMVVSNDLADSSLSPHLVVGLTAKNTAGFVWASFTADDKGTQPAGLKAWNTKSIYTCFTVNKGSPGCYKTIFDTGASAGSFETGDSGDKKGRVDTGSQVTTTVPGLIEFSTSAGKDENENLYYYDPAHGSVAGYNSGAGVFRYYVVAYDAVSGKIGFAPLQNVLLGTIHASSDADLGVDDGSVLLMGKLVIEDALSSDRAIALGTGAKLHVKADATLSGTLSGSVDTAVKIATGKSLTLSGVSTYDGAMTVSGRGTLIVDGSLAASLLLDRSTLAGSGIVGDVAVAKGATIAPGHSVGTLTVNGGAVFGAGSTYKVELGSGDKSDLMSVLGSAMLAGGEVVVSLTDGATPVLGLSYTILTAGSGVTGAFSSVSAKDFGGLDAAFPFLAPELVTGSDAVTLQMVRSDVRFTAAARTANEAAVARSADAMAVDTGVLSALASLNAATAPAAFDALSGEIYASAQTVMLQQSIFLRDAVGARLRQSAGDATAGAGPLFGPSAAPLSDKLTPAVWAQGFGGWGRLSADGNATSVNDSIGGMLFGLDAEIAGWRVGAVGGISQSSFSASARGSSGTMDNYDIGLYAGTQAGPLGVTFGAAYGWHDVSADRTIAFPGYWGTASGDYSAGTAQVFGEVSAALPVAAVQFEPFAGLAYVHVEGVSFGETGTAAALAVDTGAQDVGYSTLGLRGAVPTVLFGQALTVRAALGWQHAFGDTTPFADVILAGSTLPASIAGVPVARDTALVGAGLRYAVAPGAEFALKYAGQIATGNTENAVTGQLRWQF
ncbi:autotransporter family protein [Xanthobacter agilis]|uniref:autotransporter family protein n=1 Tax=Xanthobacter agilis TaxID=47492 RepID=UPI00372AB3D2